MRKISKSIIIKADQKTIFRKIDTPETISTFSFIVKNVIIPRRTARRLGDKFCLIFNIGGISFTEEFTIVKYRKPVFVQCDFKGRLLTGSLLFGLTRSDGGIKVNFYLEYQVLGLLQNIGHRLILRKGLEHGMEHLLENLKIQSESKMATNVRRGGV